MQNPSNNNHGATWFSGGTWLTGGTWMRRLASPAVAFAMAGALLVPAATDGASAPEAPRTIDASGISNQEISFSYDFAALALLDDVSLIEKDNLVFSDTRDLHNKGIRGAGIDIAIIDSGTALVEGLDAPGKVIYGPDLSDEGTNENLANIDTFGHGTHMAGIAAGNDGTADGFVGVAPDSRIVSLKIGGASGGTSVAQAIAAIEWVIEHKNANGMNIRVLNLSFGVQNVGSTANDPLSAVVERAWDAGIVVVVAAGNEGNNSGELDSPAISPYVLAVAGGVTHKNDGGIPTWTSEGNGLRDPDIAAKGKSIVSLRVPGSTLDTMYPIARVGERFIKGSGTSQSAALMSGNVALLLSHRPELTPDQVKGMLIKSAKEMDPTETRLDGQGMVNARSAILSGNADTTTVQDYPRALGITDWSNVDSWTGGRWNGATWSGATWSGATWSGATWSGATWSGATWSGATWSGATWSGATWSGATWSGATWSGAAWGDDGWTVVGNATSELPPGQSRAAAYSGDSDARLDPAAAADLLADRPAEGQDVSSGFIAE